MISFAGDALVCLFLDDEVESRPAYKALTKDERESCCIRAVQCGLSVTKCCVASISAHVAVSFGKVSLGLLGGHCGQCSFLMNGKCVDQIAECMSRADVGELVVTQEVFDSVTHYVMDICDFFPTISRSHVAVDNRLCLPAPAPSPGDNTYRICLRHDKTVFDGAYRPRQGFRLPSKASSLGGNSDMTYVVDVRTQSGIVSCVPPPVIDAIAANTFNDLSELRTVTTLFLKLDTYRTDQYLDLADLQPFFLAMQVCLEECGGMLRQFIIDDKGCVLIGLWGVPGASYAGNCSRAVRCAWMMKAEASSYHHSVSIGITTGSVYCGIIGTEYRRDYVAIGKSVNVSARLVSKANGRILLDESTVDKLCEDFSSNIEPVHELVMKGVQAGARYFSFASPHIPLISDSIVHGDKAMVISDHIRRHVVDAVTMLESLMCHVADCCVSEKTPAPVLVIKGMSGVGKTVTLNHIIRRMKNHIATATNEALRRVDPIFISVACGPVKTPFRVMRSIIEFVWAHKGCVSDDSRATAIANFLLDAYPSETPFTWEKIVFPVVRDVLGITWPFPSHLLPAPLVSGTKKTRILSDVDIVSGLTLFALRSAPCAVVALDAVNVLSSLEWEVLTNLCLTATHSLFLLTLTVREGLGERADPFQRESVCNGWLQDSVSVCTTTYTCSVLGTTLRAEFCDQKDDTTVPIQ